MHISHRNLLISTGQDIFSPSPAFLFFTFIIVNIINTVSGSVVKETSKLGPRPEKPIEIYEFERYFYSIVLCQCFEIDGFS